MRSVCLCEHHSNFLSGFYFCLFLGCNSSHYVVLRNSKDCLNETANWQPYLHLNDNSCSWKEDKIKICALAKLASQIKSLFKGILMFSRLRQNDPSAHTNASKITQTSLAANSLEDIAVELFLSVTQELANHLPTQAFPLEQEMGHTHWSVWNKVSLYQILDAFFWFPGETGVGRKRETERDT